MKTVGAGGKDRNNCAPMCHKHHVERHNIGIKSFQEKYDIDLEQEARKANERISV